MDAIRYAVYNHNAKSFTVPRAMMGLVKPFPGKRHKRYSASP
jgi:hypothetical protein